MAVKLDFLSCKVVADFEPQHSAAACSRCSSVLCVLTCQQLQIHE
jgi:hypothetical protein